MPAVYESKELLSLVAPALAKEGGEAVLDAPVPRDAVPGTTIEIGWTIVIPLEGGGTGRMFGTPTYVRLVSPDGTSEMQAYGHETAPESGHYVATVDVPAGGIGQVVIALAGTSCDAAGGCSQSDFVFPIVGDSLTAADPAAVPPAAAPEGAAAAATSTSSTADAPTIALLAVALVGFALAAAAVLVGRRRTRGIGSPV